jgi:hypothetical protein
MGAGDSPWAMSSRLGLAALLLFASFAPLACRQPVAGPETSPVRGKIVFTKGGTAKDLADHSIFIQLQSTEQPDVVASGEILEDGAFSVTTQVEGVGKAGAIKGKHRVRLNADENAARYIAPKFLNYETSGLEVTVPHEGELEIKVFR